MTTSRRTLTNPATIDGITLFTGVQSRLTIHPRQGAEAGIEFRRTDLPGSPLIPADVRHVITENRRTVLAADPAYPKGPSVQTVEHILSALAGLGITNAVVDVSAPEVPIVDGSSLPFVEAILAAGITTLQPASGAPLVLTESLEIIDDKSGASIIAEPSSSPGLHLEYHVEYPPGAPIPSQSASLSISPEFSSPAYITDIAPARTFCLLQEAQAMRQMGLFKHLTPREMVVIGLDGPIDNALRFPNEPARHKLLDLLGDLALSTLYPLGLQAKIVARRSGHAHNHQMARALQTALLDHAPARTGTL